MSYVGDPFQHDIFVTYSHADAERIGKSKMKAWSQAFIRELEAELRVNPKLESPLRLFFDDHHRLAEGLDPMSGLTEQLRADVEGSALLAVLMTPQYLSSMWCAAERKWWHEAQERSPIGASGRVAIARVCVAQAPWPQPLSDSEGVELPGFWFYDRNQPQEMQRPFAWPEPASETGDPFRSNIVRLAGWLGLKLDDLRRRLEERRLSERDAKKLAEPTGQTLYLHGRVDSAKAWEKVVEILSHQGFAVFPSEPDPLESSPEKLQRLSSTRVEMLSGCDALLLLGAGESRAVDADLVVVGNHDRQAARARSNRLLPCALLDTVGAAIATPRRVAAARAVRVEWLDGTAEPWVPRVQDWLSRSSGLHSSKAEP